MRGSCERRLVEMSLSIILIFSIIIMVADSIEMDESKQMETREKICFNNFGCFSLKYPWNQVWGYLPEDPKTLDTKFYIRSRNIMVRKELPLKYMNKVDFLKPLVLIVHGFRSSANATWVHELEAAYINREDVNVITVDWNKGASGPNYLQAIANMRVIAAEISSLLEFIVIKYRNGSIKNIHLLGQSLGAHLVSYVRIKSRKLPYITGLDPAQPWFVNKSQEVKLDETDADFVVVIHTDTKPFWPSLGLGIDEPSGHVDFYINGGVSQPGCLKNEKGDFLGNPVNSAMTSLSCSHHRAQEYLTEALLSDCSFWGVKWNLNQSYPISDQIKCTLENCQEMGKFTRLLPARGTFFVKTADDPPYCGNFFSTSRILQFIKYYVNKLDSVRKKKYFK